MVKIWAINNIVKIWAINIMVKIWAINIGRENMGY